MLAVEARLRELRPKLADATYKTYAYNIMRMKRVSRTLDLPAIKKELDKIAPVQARNILTALVVYDGARWRKMHEHFMSVAEGHLYDQTLTDRESANWTNWAEIKKVVKRLTVHKLSRKDGRWIAVDSVMATLKKKSQTRLKVAAIDLKTEIPDTDVSREALER